MTKIQRLDDFTINCIAAGEVVEKPAAVVKELFENSIDAGATAITISIEQGGINEIKIIDNGIGIEKENIKLAFERHTTSKINKMQDLETIDTMGFRGEALASIAAVSMVEMVSRIKNATAGNRLILHGGVIQSFEETGCPQGTTITIKNLFYNAPARKKFMKSARAESAAISELMAKLILCNPNVSVKYINNGKTIYHSSGSGKIVDAAHCIYGKEIKNQCFTISAQYEQVELTGLIGDTALLRHNRNHQVFMVNGRLVQSTMLQRAIEMGYAEYLMVRQYPWIILNVKIPQSLVDVNVHPQKTIVKFHNEEKIYDFVQSTIQSILSAKHHVPEIAAHDVIKETQVAYQNNKGTIELVQAKEATHKEVTDLKTQRFSDLFASPLVEEDIVLEKKDIDLNVSDSISEEDAIREAIVGEALQTNLIDFGDISSEANNALAQAKRTTKLRGALFDTYLLVEVEEEIYIIDQHAAHERLIYEQLKLGMLETEPPSQMLLVPYIYATRHDEREQVFMAQANLKQLGFDIEAFGKHDIIIRSVPYVLRDININQFFSSLFKDITTGQIKMNLEENDILLAKLSSLACKKAIKAKDQLSEMEIERLVDDIINNNIPLTCPHGRPIMVTLKQKDIERIFKRIT